MLLKKQLPRDSVRCAHQRYRPSPKMLQHQGSNQPIVAYQVYFGEAGGGIDYPFRVRYTQ